MNDLIRWTIFCYIWNVDHMRKDYLYIGINGFVSLMTESGGSKDDLKLLSDEALMKWINFLFSEGKNLIVSVMPAMGKEQICTVEDISWWWQQVERCSVSLGVCCFN
ncbi:Eukaryotic translation initiation factor 5A [Bienertia sinuspersici]